MDKKKVYHKSKQWAPPVFTVVMLGFGLVSTCKSLKYKKLDFVKCYHQNGL